MTLKKSLMMAMMATTCMMAAAEAYIVPGAPPQRPPASNREERKVINLNRRVSNETLSLLQLARMGSEYNGYEVTSVDVDVRSSDRRAELSLLGDGRLEDSVYAPQGVIRLLPRYRAVIGEDIRNLGLEVRSAINIRSITINLVNNRGGTPGRTLDVPLSISRRLSGNSRLDITPYIDMNRYRGYKLAAIEVEAAAAYKVALIDIQINSFNQGSTIQLDTVNRVHTVRVQNLELGRGADNIVLSTRGDLNLRKVTLKLVR
ncbi:MAG: hypothetical protein AAGB31_09770 [Bdellovibrio sp.]